MGTFRNNMDRLLKDFEESIIITNPHERGRTFLRKIIYRTLLFFDRIGKWLNQH